MDRTHRAPLNKQLPAHFVQPIPTNGSPGVRGEIHQRCLSTMRPQRQVRFRASHLRCYVLSFIVTAQLVPSTRRVTGGIAQKPIMAAAAISRSWLAAIGDSVGLDAIFVYPVSLFEKTCRLFVTTYYAEPEGPRVKLYLECPGSDGRSSRNARITRTTLPRQTESVKRESTVAGLEGASIEARRATTLLSIHRPSLAACRYNFLPMIQKSSPAPSS